MLVSLVYRGSSMSSHQQIRKLAESDFRGNKELLMELKFWGIFPNNTTQPVLCLTFYYVLQQRVSQGNAQWKLSGCPKRERHMHSGTYQGSPEGERHTKGNNENEYAIPKLTGRSYIDSNDVAKTITETYMPFYCAEAADDKLPIPGTHQFAEPIENHGACPPASFPQFSGAPSTLEKGGFSDSQGVEYNQLLSKYYELEDQKQKVLQHFQESYWHYQSSCQFSISHAYQGSDYVSSHPSVLPSCYPCCCGGCSYCSSCNTCWSLSQAHQIPAAGQHVSESCSHFMPTKQAIYADDRIVKTAMEAAEKAISAMKLEASATPENEKGNVETSLQFKSGWYSAAGFHTGRYLWQQSSKKNQQ